MNNRDFCQLHILFSLLFCISVPAFGQVSELNSEVDIYRMAGSGNHHFLKQINHDWDMVTPNRNISATVRIPILVSKEVQSITFSKSFQIPDSLKDRNLVIWFPGINGMATISLNTIELMKRSNLPTGFKIKIPMNLLNISGENTLEIAINKLENPEEGIPNLVKTFKPRQCLGITGDIYLEWLPNVYFGSLTYAFEKNKLSFKYQLNIDEAHKTNREINPKIYCQEVIRDPQGKIVFSRFEYIEMKAMAKGFERSTYITDPQTWSPESPHFYTLYLTAKSGTGTIAYFEQKIGLREISFSKNNMLINDNPVPVKGINYRLELPIYGEDSVAESGQTSIIKKLREDFIDIKNLGFNAIRFPNSTPHPFCFYLADSLGLNLFCEIGLWRIPEPYFRNDHVLQISKKIADEIILHSSLHPSFTALGIGNEIPIHLPSVKKYMLILKGYIEQKSNLHLYLIPLNLELISQRPITEFYMYNKYDHSIISDFNNIINAEISNQSSPLFFSNVGFSLSNISELMNDTDREHEQSSRLQKFIQLASNQENIGGYFIESYRDWPADNPSILSATNKAGNIVYPYGLISCENDKRDLYFKAPQLLNGQEPASSMRIISQKKSNFFSISVFLFSVAILFIYRRNYRFRENLKRSMAHPYGFYVDLRDRRIISILNSTIIGLYTNFLVSTVIAAYIFYMRDNILFEELASSILIPINAQFFYFEILRSPLYVSVVIWLVFYLLQLTIVILLKILNLLATEKIRFKQYLAVCNWAGAPLFLLFPVSMLSYHLMHIPLARPLMIVILLLFFFWYNFRLGNGLRVLLSMRIYMIVLLLVFIYGGTIFTLGLIYESNYGLLTYLQLLKDANPLF